MAKCIFQTKGERKIPAAIQSRDERQLINNKSLTLPVKSKYQSELLIKSLKEQKRLHVNHIPNEK